MGDIQNTDKLFFQTKLYNVNIDKKEKQVHKVPQCEECEERNKIVDDVIEKIEENKEKEPKKKTIFDFFKSIDQFNHSVINFKIEITWPKDSQDI